MECNTCKMKRWFGLILLWSADICTGPDEWACLYYLLREESLSRSGSFVVFFLFFIVLFLIENALSIWILGVDTSWCAKFINRKTSWRSVYPGGLWYFLRLCGSSATGGWKDETTADVWVVWMVLHLELYQLWSREIISIVSVGWDLLTTPETQGFLKGK